MSAASNPFAPSLHELEKERVTRRGRAVTGLLALALAVPVVVLLGVIFVEALPVISLELIWGNATDKGRGGGLWAPLIGTFYLVVTSVLIVSPLGIGAAIYLNEYAREGRATRIIGLAVTSLAGVPSIVHALFGLGAFVLFAGMGASVKAAACTIAGSTFPLWLRDDGSASALLAGPLEIAVVGEPGAADTAALRRIAFGSTSPGAVIAVGLGGEVPLLRDRSLVDGGAAAYVCQGFVCQRPETSAQALAQLVQTHPAFLPTIGQ